ncbi:MAG: DegT/DnrJ/EryC1/StrS family aminotransferase [Alphaproteobacteria bacterium]|nr:DegT/DnrJ/EryC1/StrS family aminotransferase [Alphaproteobacteria bacterium]
MTGAARLAIDGGAPVRAEPMPMRQALGADERKAVLAVLDHYAESGADPGYGGPFEQAYAEAFTRKMGAGFADPVATGSAAVFICLKALDLPAGSEVIVPPICDPGTYGAVILAGLVPCLADAAPGTYNLDPAGLEKHLTGRTKALIVVHAAGLACDMTSIMIFAKAHSLQVVEDASQAHFARHDGVPVGRFGDVAAFSTMYRKAHISGGSGGITYTISETLWQALLAHSDRGKPSWREDFDDRDPTQFLGPGLNFHTDEISCAIGTASLARLDDSIRARRGYVTAVCDALSKIDGPCRPMTGWDGDISPFILPIFVDPDRIRVTVKDFANAVRAEGIPLNPHYEYCASTWPWLRPHLAGPCATPVAERATETSFALYLNERYAAREADDTVEAIAKVSKGLVR